MFQISLVNPLYQYLKKNENKNMLAVEYSNIAKLKQIETNVAFTTHRHRDIEK